LPHGVPTDKKLENGDFLTMDFGARVNGYCSDMTRTVAIGGVSEKQKLVYDTVLKAQSLAFEGIKAGAVCKEIDALARDYIYGNGFEGSFGHGLGHSLGLDIHENPAFNTRDLTLLESGMIMTVEPGIYLENEFGVRIEDMVYITSKGAENLTKSDKSLIII
jgi:Xaa-Pro aminopeptidase